MIITFQGASDDLIEIGGDAPGADEYNAGYGSPAGTFSVEGGTIDLVVEAYYAKPGVWCFAARQRDEGIPFPEDLMILTTTNETINDYTTMLWIDTKEVDVRIRKVEGTK